VLLLLELFVLRRGTHMMSTRDAGSSTAGFIAISVALFLIEGRDVGLAVILVFIGAKFLLTEVVVIGVGVSLLVIVGVMTAAAR
jgi:hypothetical protein